MAKKSKLELIMELGDKLFNNKLSQVQAKLSMVSDKMQGKLNKLKLPDLKPEGVGKLDSLNFGIGAGIGYGLITIGTQDYHFTAGAGFGTIFQNNEWQNTERPIVTLSANTRLTRRFSLVSENWLFQLPFDHQVEKTDTLNGVISTYMETVGTIKNQVAITTLGGRFVWEKLSLDLGILAPINFQDINLILPYIDLAVKF